MNPVKTTLTFVLLAGFLALAVPAHASSLPLPCAVSAADTDHDGFPEPSVTCTSPPCGCLCPYVVAGAGVQAAGQEVFVVGEAGCSPAAVAHADPGAVNPTGPVVVTPILVPYVP